MRVYRRCGDCLPRRFGRDNVCVCAWMGLRRVGGISAKDGALRRLGLWGRGVFKFWRGISRGLSAKNGGFAGNRLGPGVFFKFCHSAREEFSKHPGPGGFFCRRLQKTAGNLQFFCKFLTAGSP